MIKLVQAHHPNRRCRGCGKVGVYYLLLSDGSGTLNAGLCRECYSDLRKLLEVEGETVAQPDAGPRARDALQIS